MPISLNWQHQRRAGNGNDFRHWMLNTKEEKGSVKNIATIFSTPKKKKEPNGNSFQGQQRQLENAENPLWT